MNNELAARYSRANNYVENATKTLVQMKQNQPKDIIENGLIKKGIIVRHLILPTHTEDSIKCLDFIEKNLGKDSIVSIMSQYEPRYNAKDYPEINRKITQREYNKVLDYCFSCNFTEVYVQDLKSATKDYIPKFDLTGL